MHWPTRQIMGSSPLTRGKPPPPPCAVCASGLIPAHAGKTGARSPATAAATAHPRSRGENKDGPNYIAGRLGSSPLTRGKRSDRTRQPRQSRLIPAHAGKTRVVVRNARQVWAHPRSRGENPFGWSVFGVRGGSSPLTRGKHVTDVTCARCCGLIPAHAGKTLPDLRFYCADRSDLGNP